MFFYIWVRVRVGSEIIGWTLPSRRREDMPSFMEPLPLIAIWAPVSACIFFCVLPPVRVGSGVHRQGVGISVKYHENKTCLGARY